MLEKYLKGDIKDAAYIDEPPWMTPLNVEKQWLYTKAV